METCPDGDSNEGMAGNLGEKESQTRRMKHTSERQNGRPRRKQRNCVRVSHLALILRIIRIRLLSFEYKVAPVLKAWSPAGECHQNSVFC